MKKAFISYRRQDTEGYAHSLYDRLKVNFNHEQIFMDVDDIKPGEDFVKVLQNNLNDCAVLIVLIGKQWLNIKNSSGLRRLENPDDFVRIEVATALERKIPVIPVLVNGATMPTRADLPENLKALSVRQAVVLRGISYEFGIEQLVSSIERYFGSKRRDKREIPISWYKSTSFKVIVASFFGLLALAILLIDNEDTEKTPRLQPTTNFSPSKNNQTNALPDVIGAEPVPSTSIEIDKSKTYQLAKVMSPPSNIRDTPNGAIICKATSSSVITVIRKPKIANNNGLWYATNFCRKGQWGFIHESQIKIRK